MDILNTKKNFTIATPPAMQHTVFEIILLVIVSGLLYWFIISPKITKLNALTVRSNELSADFASLEDNERKFNKAVAEMKAHPEEIADLDEALPLDNRVTKLHLALESLTESSGMTVGDVSVAYKTDAIISGNKEQLTSPFKGTRKLQKMTTALDVTGTYDQFQGLLQKLEQSGRILTITSVEVTPTADQLLNFKITLEAFYYE